ncbi:MAG: ribokinase [Eubacteriales bacterium]|nr:ribokinase [Eubacteriales bacterium]
MGKSPKILVAGSFVMDLIVSTERFPSSGETVIGCGFSTVPGGKGANQAIQAARLGADATIIGKVGADDFGKLLIKSANESGVDTRFVKIADNAPSAVGNVQLQVNSAGTENRIIVVPGANMTITESDVSVLKEMIRDFDMVMLQNEIPMQINCLIAEYAKAAGIPVMLNPAPSAKLPAELISCLTYISPNEHEAADITGIVPTVKEDIKKEVSALRDMGVANILITYGKNGAVFGGNGKIIHSPSVDCGQVVDPTAAGDSFIGAFCTAVAAGIPIENALQFANCTAGITVTRMGAQSSLPKLEEVINIMKEKHFDTKPFYILSEKSNIK